MSAMTEVHDAVYGSYSKRSWFWRAVPHRHYWRDTTKGFSLTGAIHGAQCFRCQRSFPAEYEEPGRAAAAGLLGKERTE